MKNLPRIAMFFWKLAADVIPLKAKMNSVLNHVDPYCVMCNNFHLETSQHMFHSCNFIRAVWFGLGIQMPSYNNDFLNWIRSWFVSPLNEWKEIFSIICWHIWKYRNSVVFNKVKPNPVECIALIKKSIRDWETTYGRKDVQHHLRNSKFHSYTGGPEEWKDNVFYINASFEEFDGSYGIGLTYWLDNRLTDIRVFSGWTTGTTEPEATAMQKCMEWAVEKKIQNIKIRTDCENVVSFLNNRPSTCEWRTMRILKDVLSFLDDNNNVDIGYTSRDYTRAADQLDRWSRVKKISFVRNDFLHNVVKCKVLHGIINGENIMMYNP
ncbi:uncharacterized protein LOC113324856 [Papaver somniferum]|uniref:uncharacterized protein LOC113324856 n=1 Tax=Papaver somniferum TaxID=3469 RepID=UPI000E6FAAF1|nr:uncharacterized protein LOC113324856 [Papaver somniferum]